MFIKIGLLYNKGGIKIVRKPYIAAFYGNMVSLRNLKGASFFSFLLMIMLGVTYSSISVLSIALADDVYILMYTY